MNKVLSLFIAVCVLFMVSCNFEKKASTSDAHEAHWSYEGETSPEHWAEIEKNSDCGGMFQSPVNILTNNTIPVKDSTELEVYYNSETLLHMVENNGHSIQFDFSPGDSISYKGKMYYLKQIHFHEPSEHKINGLIYPIETHLVHISKDNNITVLGLMGIEGTESQLFELFRSFLPIKIGDSKEINEKIDLTGLLLEDQNYYSYNGSLTTPPCTENVNWIIFQQPVVLSLDEVLIIRANMPLNNYRIEQPLNGRVVYNSKLK